ncbi:beta-ketoacyl synthase chain length factor [Aquabacterium sp.]|uniref:beta-ketoacyl synthase chain length factor n=1 Tax=Aquabacterium sp. TaxID=1872578 RepID=UPI00248A6BDA|nr:beta-ketoacyl synthase chain length factor [Aquabacterium sp.]MDI1258442.1 beta-ketoacyl synthase chain length factor [Aquabacterium sp.]
MSAVSLDLAVLGVGLWAEGLGSWDDARARWHGHAHGAAPSASTKPQTTLLPAAERRRAPATVLLALAVAEQACREAKLDAREMRSVFTSAHGDLALTDYLCATLAESPEHLSPTKFHHSVHNAASGYWTIGVGNRQASTAISAGPQSFAQGLLEAATQVVCEQASVLLVAYDMPAPSPLVPITQSTALVGLALVLAPVQRVPADGGAPRTLLLRLQDGPTQRLIEAPPGCCDPDIEALMPRSPMAVGLPLAQALAANGQPQAAELRFRLSPAQSLIVTLTGRNQGARR